MSWIISIKPYKDPAKYYLVIFNYVLQLFFNYLLILFTDFVDIKISNDAGDLFIYGTLVSIFVNLIYNLVPGFYRLNLYCKRRKLWKKEREAREIRKN